MCAQGGPGTSDPDPGRATAPAEREIQDLFDRVAPHYDQLNDILSFGLHRSWRRATLRSLQARPDDVVLDLGCGTGALAAATSMRATVVGLDLSVEMLRRARRSAPTAAFVRGSASRLPFRDATFTAVMSAFVFRNLQDLPGAFAELTRTLRPGGRLAAVDLIEPSGPILRRLFAAYFSTAAPAIGAAVGLRRDYLYLVRSLGQIPKPPEICRMLARAGFLDCRARRLAGGVATLITARASGSPRADG